MVSAKCAGGCATGWTLVGLLLVGGAAYVGGGVAYGQRVGLGAGLQAHPHYTRMVELRALVDDGLAFARGGKTSHKSRSRARGSGGGGYGAVDGVEEVDERSPKREKKERKERKGKKEKKERRGEAERPRASDATATDKPAPAPAPAPAPVSAGTAAGDGGRWVHVPG